MADVRILADGQALVIPLEEAKAHLRVEIADDDALISASIRASVAHFEREIGVTIATKTLRLTLDDFPGQLGRRAEVSLPRPPAQSLVEVRYLDVDGVETILDPSSLRLRISERRASLGLQVGRHWPATQGVPGAVEIDYTAGMGSVSGDLRAGLLLMVGHLYENREAVVTGTIAIEVPLGVEAIIRSFRSELAA